MNINELEYKPTEKKENANPKPVNDVGGTVITADIEEPSVVNERSRADWLLILNLTAALSVVIGILVGLICGFFVGKLVYEGRSQTEQTDNNEETSMYDQFDYSKIVINEEQNITIQSFYDDNQERFYAMQLIGTKIPELKYLNSEEQEMSIKDLGEDRYIIEFIEPNCAYCNKMITIMDAYRQMENSYKLIGLSIKSGDITKFNEQSENTYMLINKDADTDNLVDLVVWVPTILYVEKGEIKLVTFGLLENAEEVQKNANIAFNRGE
jgi:hypothetical protein